jgi:hypothetical protein
MPDPTYDALMKYLALMTALKDHVDPSDARRAALNTAWDVAREEAAKAAKAWVEARGKSVP